MVGVVIRGLVKAVAPIALELGVVITLALFNRWGRRAWRWFWD